MESVAFRLRDGVADMAPAFCPLVEKSTFLPFLGVFLAVLTVPLVGLVPVHVKLKWSKVFLALELGLKDSVSLELTSSSPMTGSAPGGAISPGNCHTTAGAALAVF